MKCENELRRDLFANIVLSGGNTLFDTLGDRLTKEIFALTPKDGRV